jgi:DNA-binding NarL/FixJ family response regulator
MGKTILIADDSPVIRKKLREMFQRESGYEICAEAVNGQEAIDLAVEHRPALIVLDLSMPVLNGLDASRQLKKIMPDVPIILFTQHADLEARLFANGLCADRVVSKADASQLLTHIRELVPA